MIVGIGGQGAITLKRILEYAALNEPNIRKMIGAEKHGLAQREGSVDVYVRFLLADKEDVVPEYYMTSPTVGTGELDLVIGLEPLEVLRNAKFTNKDTVFVINSHSVPPPVSIAGIHEYPTLEQIKEALKDISSSSKFLILNGTELAMNEMKDAIYTNNIMLGAAIATGTLPIKKENIEKTITEQLKDSENNIKALNIGFEYGTKLFTNYW